MSFQPLNHEFTHVRSLPNRPRLSDGYTPEAIKACFDLAGEIIQDYINQTLLPALQSREAQSSAAEALGSAAVGEIPSSSIHAQLCALDEQQKNLKELLQQAAAGVFPPESIPLELLEESLRDTIAASTEKDAKIAAFTTPGSHTFVAPRSGLYRIRMCGAGGGGSYYHPMLLENEGIEAGQSFPGRGGAAGAALEAILHLEQGEEFSLSIGQGGEVCEIPEGDSASLEEGYELSDLRSYMEDLTWVSVGEESSFSKASGEMLFRCQGGNPLQRCSQSESDCATAEAVFLHPSPSFVLDKVAPLCDEWIAGDTGASSALGQGGFALSETKASDASYGGGGSGGLLHLTAPLFDIDRAAKKGGDGAIFIEYIQ